MSRRPAKLSLATKLQNPLVVEVLRGAACLILEREKDPVERLDNLVPIWHSH